MELVAAVAAFITKEVGMVALVRNGMGRPTGLANKEKREEMGVGITTISRMQGAVLVREVGEVGVGEVKRQEHGKAREETLPAVEVVTLPS